MIEEKPVIDQEALYDAEIAPACEALGIDRASEPPVQPLERRERDVRGLPGSAACQHD